jgi:hypothetical protein
LPPEVFTKLFSPSFETISYFQRRIDYSRPRHVIAGVEIENQSVWLFQMICRRAPRMDFDNAGLHQPEQTCQVINDQHCSIVTDINASDVLAQALPRVLGEETLLAHPGRTAKQAQGTTDDMWEYPLGDIGIEFRQSLFRDAGLIPEDALWVREPNIWQNRLVAGPRSCRCDFKDDLFCRLVLSQSFERGLAEQSILRPSPVFHLANEAGLSPADTLLGPDWQALAEGWLRGGNLFEVVAQRSRHGAGIAGADAASITQPSSVEVAEQ